jgi:hypothetical protein
MIKGKNITMINGKVWFLDNFWLFFYSIFAEIPWT